MVVRSSDEATATASSAGNAQARSARTPKRSMKRLRTARAAFSEICCAVIAPTSISNGSGASAGRKPLSRATSGASNRSGSNPARSNSAPRSLSTTRPVSSSSGSTSTPPGAASTRTSRPSTTLWSPPRLHSVTRSRPKTRKRSVVSSKSNGWGMARNAIARTVGTNVYGMDVEEIAPHLWHWSAPHPDWKPSNRGKDGQGWDQMVSSYALVGDDAFVLIDPQIPEDESQAARLWDALDRDVDAHGPPAIVISVYWHTRSAEDIASRYDGSSTWAPADAPKSTLERARGYDTGDELP